MKEFHSFWHGKFLLSYLFKELRKYLIVIDEVQKKKNQFIWLRKVCNIHGIRQVLKHHDFEVLVDCKASKYLRKERVTTNCLTALLLKLHSFNFEHKYQQGKKIFVSGALSR